LASASIDTYLLEKSRVALFPVGERNYHVFYQLLRGAGGLERKRWCLRDIREYTYLNCGQSKDIEDVDDKADFSKLTSGLLSVGINMVQQDLIFRVLSAILLLGNITFEPVEGPSGETAEIETPKVIARVAELLGVRKQSVESILKSRSLDMASSGGRTSSYRIPLDVQQACYARDAVAKTIYDTVFHWLIQQIRHSLQSTVATGATNYIGVLDIFGFESFEKNGLEQLLINYANESLQLIFNKAVLDAEQDIYVQEGLMVDPIEYVNNDACVNLIATGRDAILTSLDAVCRAPEPSEEKFNTLLQKVTSLFMFASFLYFTLSTSLSFLI
jgi:myosin heavy subunit